MQSKVYNKIGKHAEQTRALLLLLLALKQTRIYDSAQPTDIHRGTTRIELGERMNCRTSFRSEKPTWRIIDFLLPSFCCCCFSLSHSLTDSLTLDCDPDYSGDVDNQTTTPWLSTASCSNHGASPCGAAMLCSVLFSRHRSSSPRREMNFILLMVMKIKNIFSQPSHP